MPTLTVGVLVVVVSTAGFALAMFGRRPLPQPAMAAGPTVSDPVNDASEPTRTAVAPGRRGRRARDGAPSTADDGRVEPRLQVDVPANVRIRAAFLLGLGVIVAAGIVGILVSILAVGFFTLLG